MSAMMTSTNFSVSAKNNVSQVETSMGVEMQQISDM